MINYSYISIIGVIGLNTHKYVHIKLCDGVVYHYLSVIYLLKCV